MSRIPKPGAKTRTFVESDRLPSSSSRNVASTSTVPPRPKLRRSQSMTVLNAGNIRNTAITKDAKVTIGVKRTALAETATKPNKIVKTAPRIPDWDYKSRFNALNEKHQVLNEKHRSASALLDGAERLRISNEELNREVSELKDFKAKAIQGDLTIAKLELDIRNVRDKYQDSERNCEHLNSEIIDLNNKLAGINSEKLKLIDKVQGLQGQNAELEKTCEKLKDNITSLKTNLTQSERKQEQTRLDFSDLKGKYYLLEEKCQCLTQQVSELKKIVDEGRRLLFESEVTRRKLNSEIQDLKGNIRVFCRLRPSIGVDEQEQSCGFNFLDETTIEIRKHKEPLALTNNHSKNSESKSEFTFDKIFTGDASQEEVFYELAQLVQSSMDGYHVCVFAYGQTGSGKTFTMQGNDNNLGIIPRTIDLIFVLKSKLEKSGWEYEIKASFLEIYNETLRDLLNCHSNNLEIRYNEGKGITVSNLQIISVESAEALKHHMEISHRNRAVAATNFNEHSSRSHAVTKIYIEGHHRDHSTTYIGSVNLVDLAGSESAKTSSAERLTETKNINKSLSTLGSVMLALYNKKQHIPYRNSKLTYLLQSCLGGNSKTLMFVNVSPSIECYGESVNSLRFASKVKEVKTDSKRNKLHLTPSQE